MEIAIVFLERLLNLSVFPGLGQQRLMPSGLYAQEKACKQEERLLERLQSIDLDPTLIRVLQHQITLLLEGWNHSLHL